jgi:regulator of sirC expression with transglutaminase-like and TPR domain
MLARPEEEMDLARACLLVAAEEYPALDVEHYLRRLDEMAAEARRHLRGAATPADEAEALRRYLFGELGFAGNTSDYYDPRNSFLNDVIDLRTGIPITLSTVYVEVGRRAGVEAHGVGLPGHFIAKVGHGEDAVLVDAFGGGSVLSSQECQDRLDRVFEGRMRLEPGMLEPWGPRAILGRVLRNLKAVYAKAEDDTRALWVIELLLRLEPGAADEIRDRGLIYAALDCYGAAATDLERYLVLAPHSPDAAAVREKAAQMRTRASRLN